MPRTPVVHLCQPFACKMDNENKSVVNFSQLTLEEQHISLLERGLKFCPTPFKPNAGELREDLDRMHRRLRQIAFFEDPESDPVMLDKGENIVLPSEPFSHRKFRLKSTGKGPTGPLPLEAMITANEQDFNSRPPLKKVFKKNITNIETKAMMDLANNNNIIIRPADKGSAVVILNRQDYLKEGYKQLQNVKFYKYLENDLTEIHIKSIANYLEDMYQNGEIDDRTKDYLLSCPGRTSELYLLPKIHKSSFSLENMPSRPIMSANGSPTEKISEFVDHFLNPTTFDLPAYVRDTTDFLRKLKQIDILPEGTLLVTLDVESLYTNIPNDFGLRAARITLQKERNTPGIKPSNESLLKLLRLVLTSNNFKFNGSNFLQVGGCTMGSKVSVGYANNSLGYFETLHVYTYPDQPLIYLRFIDDIFIIWTKGLESLHDFVKHMNSCTTFFKFTSEISEDSVTFLDTRISLVNGALIADLYCKPTDSHNYLFYSSAHPRACKDSIPYSQFLRIRRICSKYDDFYKHCITLCAHFIRRNYPGELLEEALYKASLKNRDDLLEIPVKKDQEENNSVFLITTYHPHHHFLQDIVRKNWDFLGRSTATNYIHSKKLVCGYRRPKNLRSILMRAKVDCLPQDNRINPFYREPEVIIEPEAQKATKQKTMFDYFTRTLNPAPHALTLPTTTTAKNPKIISKKERGFNWCDKSLCRYCPLIDRTGTITCSYTNEHFNTMKNVSCRSSNLIYSITCRVCKIQYVGQTRRQLQARFAGHFNDVQNSLKHKSVSAHFSQRSHKGTKDFIIHVLEFIRKPPKSTQAGRILLKRETHWMNSLRSHAPIGLNLEDPKEFKGYKT